MEYERIPVYLNRYSFSSKMSICFKYSLKTMKLLEMVEPDKLRSLILPWDLETFLLFVAKGKEYQSLNISEKNERKFLEIIRTIRANDSSNRFKSQGEGNLAYELIMHLGMIQFDLQEAQIYKYFRYNYFYNFQNDEIDMTSIFQNMFGAKYEDFWSLSIVLNVFLTTGKATRAMQNLIIERYKLPV